MTKIILASTSPRRKELFGRLGIPFELANSEYVENMSLDMNPLDLAKHLSQGKAEEVALKNPDSIVIGADTFVVFENKVLGKPIDAEDAKKMLQSFSNKELSVITGYTVVDADTGKTESRAVETKVWFKDLSTYEIEQYVATGEPLDRAGSFGIQDLGLVLVDHIEGDFFSAVGLPLAHLVETLKDFGIDVWELRKAKASSDRI